MRKPHRVTMEDAASDRLFTASAIIATLEEISPAASFIPKSTRLTPIPTIPAFLPILVLSAKVYSLFAFSMSVFLYTLKGGHEKIFRIGEGEDPITEHVPLAELMGVSRVVDVDEILVVHGHGTHLIVA